MARSRDKYLNAAFYERGGTPPPLEDVPAKPLNPMPSLVTHDNLDRARERLAVISGHYEAMRRGVGEKELKAFRELTRSLYGLKPAEALAQCYRMVSWNKGMVAVLEERLAGEPRPVRMVF